MPRERIVVIPYAVDVERFRRAARRGLRGALGLEPDARVILYVGRCEPIKGIAELVESAAGLDDDVHVVLVGPGDTSSFEAQAARARVTHRVHFIGPTDTPEQYFAEADLFVFPTKHDPWGIPLVEAMAAGVPIVCTGLADAAEIVGKADAGLVLADGSPAALRGAIRSVLADASRLLAYAANGPGAAAPYDIERQLDLVLETYGEVSAEGAA